jgi:divalent metal cation (Fe/Co/Zn/Cd) transporter
MSQGGEKAIKVALFANGTIAAMKLAGALMSGSASMLAEFKHSLADASNGLFYWLGYDNPKKHLMPGFSLGMAKQLFSGHL